MSDSKTTTRTTGVKGADVWESTCSALLDYSIGAVRGASDKTILKILDVNDPAMAFVLAFHVRNVRGGKGERVIFKRTMAALYTLYPALTLDLLDLVPQYGSWCDLFDMALIFPQFRKRILNLAASQLLTDELTPVGKPISLCAKWAPRERKNSPDAEILKQLSVILFADIPSHSTRMAMYRRLVAGLNRRLKTVETFMSGGLWSDIQPATIPGRAGKIYSRAFLNLKSTFQRFNNQERLVLRKPNDVDRMTCREHFIKYFADAAAGKTSINGADTLFPHEIVRKALACNLAPEEKDQLVAIWNSMVAKIKAAGTCLEDCEVMCDFSGSMRFHDGTPFFVSIALGILISEVTGKNRILTFDSEPQWHYFPEGDLLVKLGSISHYLGQGLSTNFQKAYNLIVEDKKRKPLTTVPSFVLVLTDMNFDAACGSESGDRHHFKTAPVQTHAEMAKETFRRLSEDMYGNPDALKAPVLGIWNLSPNPTDIQATADEEGVVLLSGWSPTQFNILQQEGLKTVTPFELLKKELEAAQYDLLRERIQSATPTFVSDRMICT
jgi:hypothetical protein